MLKFLRKIRFRLLSENRSRKYILYTLGEIFLVVIGILIALQVNNWNENKKERKLEQSVLRELKKSLQADINTIKFTQNLYTSSIQTSQFVSQDYQDQKVITESAADSIGKLTYIAVMQFNKSGYKLLEDRGFDLIQEDSLRTRITNYYETQQKMIEYFFGVSREATASFHKLIQDNYYPINTFAWRPYNYQELPDHQKMIGEIQHRKNAIAWLQIKLSDASKTSNSIIQQIDALLED